MHIQERIWGGHCAMSHPSPPLGHGTKQKSTKYMLKSRNQILIKHAWGKGLRYLHFRILLISLRVEVAQILDFLLHAKILSLWKAFFNLNLPHSKLRKKDIALIFFYVLLAMACSEVAAFLKLLGHITFRIFARQCHNSLVFVARQIANNLSPIAKIFSFFLGLTRNIIRKNVKYFNLRPTVLFILILCTFCAAQNRSLKPKFNLKGLKIEWFLQKTRNFFCVFFFWDSLPESKILTPHQCTLPFRKIFIGCIKQWTKTFCKKTGRPAGQPA